MRIAIIGQDNGVAGGLTVDRQILTELFVRMGHSVGYVHRQTPPIERADVNVYLESFADAAFEQQHAMATHHVAILNLEWFPPRQLAWLASMSQIWAKSRASEEVFIANGLGHLTTFTGFAGRDRRDLDRRPHRRIIAAPPILHVQGQSQLKGTDAVLAAWHLPRYRLPPLTIVSSFGTLSRLPPNVIMVRGPVDDDRMSELLNAHRIHLCPSRAEGFGHTLAEAASIVTVNRSPMNEHVPIGAGALIEPSGQSDVHNTLPGVCYHDVSPTSIADAVAGISRRSYDDLDETGRLTRVRFEQRNAAFVEVVSDMLARIPCS